MIAYIQRGLDVAAAAGPVRSPFSPAAAATSSPRWMYAIKGGYLEPSLDDYATYYGDDRVTAFAIGGGYRLRDWLEIGASVGYSRDRGLGRTAEGGTIPDAVTQSWLPLHVYADFVLERSDRRGVPYAGARRQRRQPDHHGLAGR